MVSGSDCSSSWPNKVGLRVKPEFPIWTSDSRIVRLCCPRHNEFCRKRRPQQEIARFYCAKSCETGLSECGPTLRELAKLPSHMPRYDWSRPVFRLCWGAVMSAGLVIVQHTGG